MNIYVDCGVNSIGYFLERYGKYDQYHLFEANPDLCVELEKELPPDENVILHNKAVWIENTIMPFYFSTKDALTGPQGSTLIEGKKTMRVDYKHPIKVDAIDFDEYIKSLPEGSIHVKMDIEGAEYDVIQHMDVNGSLKLLSSFEVEFHSHKFKNKQLSIKHKNVKRTVEKTVPKVKIREND